MKWFGFALAFLGTAMLYAGIGYNRQTTLVDVGGLPMVATEHKPVPYAPLAGGLVLAGGIVLLVLPRKHRA